MPMVDMSLLKVGLISVSPFHILCLNNINAILLSILFYFLPIPCEMLCLKQVIFQLLLFQNIRKNTSSETLIKLMNENDTIYLYFLCSFTFSLNIYTI